MKPEEMKSKTYYEVLGVSEDASSEDIKAAYQDKRDELGNNDELDALVLENSLALIEEAFTILADAQKRKAYDNSRNTIEKSNRPSVFGLLRRSLDSSSSGSNPTARSSGRFKATINLPLQNIKKTQAEESKKEPDKYSSPVEETLNPSKTISITPDLLQEILDQDTIDSSPLTATNDEVEEETPKESEVEIPNDIISTTSATVTLNQNILSAVLKDPATLEGFAKGKSATVTLTPEMLNELVAKSESKPQIEPVEESEISKTATKTTTDRPGRMKATVTVPFATIKQIVDSGGDFDFSELDLSEDHSDKKTENAEERVSRASIKELEERLEQQSAQLQITYYEDQLDFKSPAGSRRSMQIDDQDKNLSFFDYILVFFAFILPLAAIVVSVLRFLMAR